MLRNLRKPEAALLVHMLETGGWTASDPIYVTPSMLAKLRDQGLIRLSGVPWTLLESAELTANGRDVAEVLR